MKRSATKLALLAGMMICASGVAKAESFRILTPRHMRNVGGDIAFVDTYDKSRIVEINRAGRVVWQWKIPFSIRMSGRLTGGADLEWIASDDSFLLVVPLSGIYRVRRSGKIVWQHRTSKVSHDADLLSNGHVIYVYGWDRDDDAQVYEVDRSGRLVWSWKAKGKIERKVRRRERRYSFAHANAVQRLPNGDTLVGLRNMHAVVLVGRNGVIKRKWTRLHRVHEARLLRNGTLLAAVRRPRPGIVIAVRGTHRRTIFSNAIGLRPIRTVQPLRYGHYLLTGGKQIVEINGAGQIVWRAMIYPDQGRRDRRRQRGVYKAVWVRR